MGWCTDCCDHCQSAESCVGQCNTEQSFCTVGSQYGASYYQEPGWGTFTRDDIIIRKLPKSKFNDAIIYINNVANKGKVPSANLSIAEETRNFIYHDKVNEIKNGLTAWTDSLDSAYALVSRVGEESFTDFRKGDIIYSDDFTALSLALSHLKLSPDACDNCNTGCNVWCDSCETCISSCEGGCVNCEECEDCEECDCGDCGDCQELIDCGQTT